MSALEEKIKDLEEIIRQLRGILSDDSWVPAEWGLTATQTIILNVLYHRRLATKQSIRNALYSTDPNGGANEGTIHKHLHDLRHKLQPTGVEFKSKYGVGWELLPVGRQIIRDLREVVGR